MLDGQALTIWAVRVSACLYAAGLAWPRFQRALWAAGLALYFAHVWGAFEYFHGWSHGAAYAETARQTGEMFGVYSGAGLYLNYLFTWLWALDVLLWEYRGRVWVRAFLAFMFFNAVVVFGSGMTRWAGVLVALAFTGRAAGRRTSARLQE